MSIMVILQIIVLLGWIFLIISAGFSQISVSVL